MSSSSIGVKLFGQSIQLLRHPGVSIISVPRITIFAVNTGTRSMVNGWPWPSIHTHNTIAELFVICSGSISGATAMSKPLVEETLANEVDDASNASSTDSSIGDRGEDETALSLAAVTVCPSHILQDGTYVHLPPSSEFERTRFFERSVAKHGLLQDDLQIATAKRSRDESSGVDDENLDTEKKSKTGKVEPQIHPLALASARIQSNGINELNRAINLQTLVATGEYFGLSNIVDLSFDQIGAKTSSKADNTSTGSGPGSNGVSGTGAAEASSLVVASEEEAHVRASYVLQRKGDMYQQAANTLKRHRRRLVAAIVSQKQIDTRWRELRRFWRLAAPEHGTRALPHAVKTTEVICADVDVYHLADSQMGRISRHIPQYASIELSADYKVTEDIKIWQIEKLSRNVKPFQNGHDQAQVEPTELSATTVESTSSPDVILKKSSRICTKAQPFAIADPSLGKIDADFDPASVTMLTLQFTIEKPSTGYNISVCLEPLTTISPKSVDKENEISDRHREDEQLLLQLQHSLFCAKLFESMRRELAPDQETIGQVQVMSTQPQSVAWLTGNSDENFLPPPSLMIGTNQPGLSPLCIIHIHDGDFKVILDCEYTLNAKLVESASLRQSSTEELRQFHGDKTTGGNFIDCGSQTPRQLHSLCQALLLHAQETYHRHSIQTEAKLCKQQMETEAKQSALKKESPHMQAVPPVKKKDIVSSPLTLQNCISLGAKILFESRIRKCIRNVRDWHVRSLLTASKDEKLSVEWLVLPLFDLASQFTMGFGSWYIDANISCDVLIVTSFGENGEYRKVKFHSEKEFEVYLKTALRRVVTAMKKIPKAINS